MKTFIAIELRDGRPGNCLKGELNSIAIELLKLEQFQQAKAVANSKGQLTSFRDLEDVRVADAPNDGWYIREMP